MTDQSELSLQAVEDEVKMSKRRGTLYYYLFGTCRKRTRSGWSPPSTTWTPLHAACGDRDGQRGEAKITLLLEVAREDGIAPDELAKERRATGITPRSTDMLTPLETLAKNPAATSHALELVFGAWPGALVDPPATVNLTPLQLAIQCLSSERLISSKIATLLRLAESTTIGVSPLVLRRSPRSGDTALHRAFERFSLHLTDIGLNIVKQLLQACPASAVVTNFYGHNILHFATSMQYDTIALRLVQLVVDNTPKMYLAAMLSTENDCGLRCVISNVIGRYYFTDSREEYTYKATPVCHIERKGLAQTRGLLAHLARETDTNGWTLLHYTAANVLCDGDPQEKRKLEMEREARAAISWSVLPPEGPRQSTKKLVDWLLQVHPQACSQRDSSGRFPLHLAVNTGKVWSNGVESLANAYPVAVAIRDPSSGLLPFMTAATQPQGDLDTIYGLLRLNPVVDTALFGAS